MKIYKVKVNGKLYEVELEAVSESSAKIESTENTASTPAPATNSASNGANVIVAPIAGKIIDVKVKVGDKVKKGQTVAVIEAMKLENEIPSSFDGTVAEIKVSKGTAVNNKDVIIVLG